MYCNKMSSSATGMLATLLLLLLPGCLARQELLEEKINNDPELSEFYRLLSKDHIANVTLHIREATLFAPTNEAFQSYQTPTEDVSLLYHMTNIAISLSDLSGSLATELTGNAPLFITRVPHPTFHYDELYVNNALIDREHSNWNGTNSQGQNQILHKIDAVLEPLRPKKGSHMYNPDVLYFLNNFESYELGGYTLKNFKQQVQRNEKEALFQKDVPSTFFIPVDKANVRIDKIDSKVIEGHVVPNHVLFTRPTPDRKEFATVSLQDPYVTLQLVTEKDRGVMTTYVKSSTRRGNDHKDHNRARESYRYPEGVVVAEIVKANIPVRRGVVHLIDRPLMIVDGNTNDFIMGKTTGLFSKFHEVLMDQDEDFKRRFQMMENTTVFAPSNEAWSNPIAQRAIQNRTLLKEILNLHIAHGLLPLRAIEQHHQKTANTYALDKKLHFNVVNREGIHTLTVDGNGVNATVIHPDIVTSNGIIHVIDRVLGIASHTVGEKLGSDPQLSKTNRLGEYDINQRLKIDSNHTRYTYFVPRDAAWDDAEIMFPSAIKKIFMPKYNYFATRILERHLVQADRVYTIADIKRMNGIQRVPAVLPTPRDILKILVKEKANGVHIVWNNREIPVHQPDVECTNGIIHILDGVLMTESDISISGATSFFTPVLSHVIMLLAVKWLL